MKTALSGFDRLQGVYNTNSNLMATPVYKLSISLFFFFKKQQSNNWLI